MSKNEVDEPSVDVKLAFRRQGIRIVLISFGRSGGLRTRRRAFRRRDKLSWGGKTEASDVSVGIERSPCPADRDRINT